MMRPPKWFWIGWGISIAFIAVAIVCVGTAAGLMSTNITQLPLPFWLLNALLLIVFFLAAPYIGATTKPTPTTSSSEQMSLVAGAMFLMSAALSLPQHGGWAVFGTVAAIVNLARPVSAWLIRRRSKNSNAGPA
jgi:hypothetical protein